MDAVIATNIKLIIQYAQYFFDTYGMYYSDSLMN